MSFIHNEAYFSLGLAFLLQQQIFKIPTINWMNTISITSTTKKAPAIAAEGIKEPTLTY
jgi:hypothetical protein